MVADAFVVATPLLAPAVTRPARHLAHRLLSTSSPRCALRVGAVNGDSRAPDRGVHRRPRFDERPLLAGPSGLHVDAPPALTRAARRRLREEEAALEDAVKRERAARGPPQWWSGEVSSGPAAHFLHIFRAMWLARLEDMARTGSVEPLTQTLRKAVSRLSAEIRKCDEAYYGNVPVKRVRDEEYDEMIMHLAEVERVYPALVVPDSPTQTIGHAAAAAAARGETGDIMTPTTLSTIMAQRFPPRRHITRMRSLANAYTPDDVTAFLVRAAKLQAQLLAETAADVGGGDFSHLEETLTSPELCVEAKVDGVALNLSYRQGRLAAAATRGDGFIGDDVTENVRGALVGRGVPEQLPEAVNVEIRGEVYIRPDEFDLLQMEDQGRLANARNGAAGGLKNKDPKEAAKRLLRFVGYECLRVPDELVDLDLDEASSAAVEVPQDEATDLSARLVVNHWPTQIDTLQGLADWGVGALSVFKLCRSEEEVTFYATATEAGRKGLPFEADGVVIKVNDSQLRQAMGSTAKSPRGAVALKFHSLGAETVVESVAMQVSRTGVVTPVAQLRPVTIGGVVVSRATLHNFDEIDRLDVAVNDTVVIVRGGDVIPKVKAVKERALEGERQRIEIPKICPSCQSPLKASREEGGATVVECENTNLCSAQGLGKLLHFCRRDAMDIQGIGAKTARKLMDAGLVATASDLFDLTEANLCELEGFQETSARNVFSAIRSAAKGRSLDRFIIGLGIPGVGRASARELALYAGSIEGLVRIASEDVEQLMKLPNVAGKSAQAIHAYLSEARVQSELVAFSNLLSLAKTVEDDGPDDAFLSSNAPAARSESAGGVSLVGKSFAFTGKLVSLVRPEAMKRIRALGGKTVSAVSRKTDYVVVGLEPGVKFHKAMRLGCRILAEEELVRLLDLASAESPAAQESDTGGANAPSDEDDCR